MELVTLHWYIYTVKKFNLLSSDEDFLFERRDFKQLKLQFVWEMSIFFVIYGITSQMALPGYRNCSFLFSFIKD